jgi:DNA-binding transcriptional MerR regulator
MTLSKTNLNSGTDREYELNVFKKEYTIDELAQVGGSTVRNIRAYQDRGILPPPFKKGRVGIYSTAHLTRLRLITDLLEKGFSMSNINEMIIAWQSGQDIGQLLGLEQILGEPWSEEIEEIITLDQLIQLFGTSMSESELRNALDLAVELNILALDSQKLIVKKPQMFKAGVILFNSGVPILDILNLAKTLELSVENIAKEMVATVSRHLLPSEDELLPKELVPKVTKLIQDIKPLAKNIVDAELSRCMEKEIRTQVNEQLLKTSKHK